MGQMLEAIADPANLALAWAKVRANAGAAGIDGQSVAAFDADAEHQLESLRRRLLSAERYVPPPVRRVEIPKPDGRMRPIGHSHRRRPGGATSHPPGHRATLRGGVPAL
jgi:retron-type reverse transcriptase